MTPLEKIELTAMKLFKTKSQCGKERFEVRRKRDEFVKKVIENRMKDGLVISCKK